MLLKKLLMVKRCIDKYFDKSFIKLNTFFTIVSILLIKNLKKDIRIYVNYKSLNNVTVKNRYTIPLIRETLNALYYAQVFIKFDIIIIFNRL